MLQKSCGIAVEVHYVHYDHQQQRVEQLLQAETRGRETSQLQYSAFEARGCLGDFMEAAEQEEWDETKQWEVTRLPLQRETLEQLEG